MKFNFTLIYIFAFVALFSDQALSLKKGKKGFCKGQILNTGEQFKQGSCSTTIQGQIPNIKKMTTSLIMLPKNEAVLEANKALKIKLAIDNIETGDFSDAAKQYYVKPQELNDDGFIKGHSHITIQKLEGNRPPPADIFAFFKGLNNDAQNGVLYVDVVREDGSLGLLAGRYRICSMASSFTHQPVIMPVAQRGAQDDCIRVTVKDGKDDHKGNKGGKDKY